MSTVKAIYHVVINTKNRQKTIPEANKRELYKYIYGIIVSHGCKLLRMNGVENHVHILLQMHPSVALADLMHEIKRSSSLWLKRLPTKFPNFMGWGKEYAAFTCSYREQSSIIEYIKGQETHHRVSSFEEELISLYSDNDVKFDEKYLK